MKKFEYLTIRKGFLPKDVPAEKLSHICNPSIDTDAELNKLGEESWELITNWYDLWIFKRELVPK